MKFGSILVTDFELCLELYIETSRFGNVLVFDLEFV